MNELALFAGAGGGLLGTHSVGINPVCAVEIGEFQREILARRQADGFLPPFPIWDDIKTFDAAAWRGVLEIVTGGFPCQAFSTASRGRKTAENLWSEMRRVIRCCEPVYVFAENVSPRAIEDAGKDLAEMGYGVDMLKLSAADVGAPHIRDRYWLLAYADDKSQLRSCIDAKMAFLPSVCKSLWQTIPDESRVDDGMANRMDRFQAIGNGQVPAVAAAALITLANS